MFVLSEDVTRFVAMNYYQTDGHMSQQRVKNHFPRNQQQQEGGQNNSFEKPDILVVLKALIDLPFLLLRQQHSSLGVAPC